MADVREGADARATIDLLVSNPIGRCQLLLAKFATLPLGTILIATGTGVSLVVLGAVAETSLPKGNVAPAVLHRSLLGKNQCTGAVGNIRRNQAEPGGSRPFRRWWPAQSTP